MPAFVILAPIIVAVLLVFVIVITVLHPSAIGIVSVAATAASFGWTLAVLKYARGR